MPDPAVSVSVANEVVGMLADATLSQTITPERNYANWEMELADANTLHVDVVAISTEQKVTPVTRSKKVKYDIPVYICIRKRFDTTQQDGAGAIEIDKIDDLVLLVQEVHELFLQERMTEFTSATWKETKILVSPNRDHLHQYKQFSGIVAITFQATRQLS